MSNSEKENPPRSQADYLAKQISEAFDERDGLLGIPLKPVSPGWTTFVYAGYVRGRFRNIDCSGSKVISVPLEIKPLDTTMHCPMVEAGGKPDPTINQPLKKYPIQSADTQIHVHTSELIYVHDLFDDAFPPVQIEDLAGEIRKHLQQMRGEIMSIIHGCTKPPAKVPDPSCVYNEVINRVVGKVCPKPDHCGKDCNFHCKKTDYLCKGREKACRLAKKACEECRSVVAGIVKEYLCSEFGICFNEFDPFTVPSEGCSCEE